MEDQSLYNNRATSNEKIILACHNIQWIAYQLSQLIASHAMSAAVNGGKIANESAIGLMKRHESALEQAAEKLKPILEDLSNYYDGIDAATQLDVRVLNPGNEVVLLGWDEYDKGYTDEDSTPCGPLND